MRHFLSSRALINFPHHFFVIGNLVRDFRTPVELVKYRPKLVRAFGDDNMSSKSTQCYTEFEVVEDDILVLKKTPSFPRVFDGDEKVSY